MAIGDLLHSMSTMVLTCSRHVSRASRKLGGVLSGRKSPAVSSFLCSRPRRRRRKNQLTAPSATTAAAEERNRIIIDDDDDDDKGEDGVWRRTILLGERCQPLDFSEAIHYDSRGRRLADPAPRRAGSPLSSFAYRSAVFAAETATAEKE